MREFEPFVRCADALGTDGERAQTLNHSKLLCPKNMTRAIPPSLEGQPNVSPRAPSIIMMSCEDASNDKSVLGMPDPESCFNGERTWEMSDEDYRVLTDLQQRSNETQANLQMQQQQVVLSEDDRNISLTT